MNEFTPQAPEPDDVDEQYRRLSDRDSRRPSDTVRRAVLRHAAQLATSIRHEQRAATNRAPAANEPRWRLATYGGLAAAALAGLLIAPHFLTPGSAPRTGVPPDHGTTPPPKQAPALAAQLSSPSRAVHAPDAPEPPVPAEPAAKLRALAEKPAARVEPRASSAAREQAMAPAMAPPSPAASLAAASPPLKAGAALREAAASGNVRRLQALLAEQVDIEARDAAGRTALLLAVLYRQREAVYTLLAAGADPNAADMNGTTPLRAALRGAQPEIATALQRAGAR